MPSRNVKDLRGYTEVSYLFIDDTDYFGPSVNNELLHSITAYEEKSNCTTIRLGHLTDQDGDKTVMSAIEADVGNI